MPPAPPPHSPNALVLDDGITGHRLQSLALARALGLDSDVLPLKPSWLAAGLAPRGAFLASPFGADFDTALARRPAWVIGCGRTAALGTRLAKQRGLRSVQILDPRLPPTHWDTVIVPEHDDLRGPNVITVRGSLHDIDEISLAEARLAFPELGKLSSPRIAVLLGGPTRHCPFTRGALEVMLAKLERSLHEQGGSLIIVGSRRTPKEWAPLLRDRYAAQGLVWMDDRDGPNPYRAALAWAERIICSPDSVNLISEACATTAPVFIAEPQRSTGRVGRFVASVIESGRAKAQDAALADYASVPMNVMQELAKRLDAP